MLIRSKWIYMCAGVLTIVAVYYTKHFILCSRTILGSQESLVEDNNKLIFLDKMPQYYNFVEGDTHLKYCDVKTCAVTAQENNFKCSDAVIFFSHWRKESIPEHIKQPNQIWIYFAVESPVYSANDKLGLPVWQNYFNWTMTYRYDSDFKFGYGRVLPREITLNENINYNSIMDTKTKLIAWLASHCQTQSKRETFVNNLQAKIHVDVYGKCGNLKCNMVEDCMTMIAQKYKFYLSFENSLCKDYITEKLYKVMQHNIVPIVRGGANYSDILPIKSFINTADYKTINDLVDYLNYLDKNPQEYFKYFEWKKDFRVIEPDPFPLCELCKRLHQPSEKIKVHENVDVWWRENACWGPVDL